MPVPPPVFRSVLEKQGQSQYCSVPQSPISESLLRETASRVGSKIGDCPCPSSDAVLVLLFLHHQHRTEIASKMRLVGAAYSPRCDEEVRIHESGQVSRIPS